MTEKSQSVRSQRSFSEHMRTLYQNIDTLVYAAEINCPNHGAGECVVGCPFSGRDKSDCEWWCRLGGIRTLIGNHTKQDDIETVELTP